MPSLSCSLQHAVQPGGLGGCAVLQGHRSAIPAGKTNVVLPLEGAAASSSTPARLRAKVLWSSSCAGPLNPSGLLCLLNLSLPGPSTAASGCVRKGFGKKEGPPRVCRHPGLLPMPPGPLATPQQPGDHSRWASLGSPWGPAPSFHPHQLLPPSPCSSFPASASSRSHGPVPRMALQPSSPKTQLI